MRTRDLIRAITKWSGKTYMDCADALGLNRQRWYRRIVNDSFTAEELNKVVEACGMKLAIIKGDEFWIPREAHGSLRAMDNGKRYSTAGSRALAYDGENELFVDLDGDYFLADYENRKIKAVNPTTATAFAEKYGDFTTRY